MVDWFLLWVRCLDTFLFLISDLYFSYNYLHKGLHLSCGSRSWPFSTTVQRWTSAPTDPTFHSTATRIVNKAYIIHIPTNASIALKNIDSWDICSSKMLLQPRILWCTSASLIFTGILFTLKPEVIQLTEIETQLLLK